MINQRIEQLRKIMKEKKIAMYYIPTSDYHDSEYVNDYFCTRAFMSGFTGSAGMLVITQDKAVLWSDGRYFIQAENEIKGTCIDFYRMGEKAYPSVLELMKQELKENDTLAFDGKVVSAKLGSAIEQSLQGKHIQIAFKEDLVDAIWKDRPALPKEEAFVFDLAYAGKSAQEKIYDVRQEIKKVNATQHILTSLDDIAWLLNIRGRDVESCPVVLSYVLLHENEVYFYVDEDKINTEVKAYLDSIGVTIKRYEQIYEDVCTFTSDDIVFVDQERVNYALVKLLPTTCKVVYGDNPTTPMKSIKNETELKNTRIGHIKDGVAVTKFMYWLKNNVGKIEMDEYSVSLYLKQLRSSLENYIECSFGTIAGYNANAAMMHYQATAENKSTLQPNGLLLVDSGGQYLEGTTDITRTFALGEVPSEWKKDFTSVLNGMAQLSHSVFLEGCSGLNLDILARQPIWDRRLDYKCGTGHGVGHLLSVHEGPQGFRWYKAGNRKEDTPLQEGMVITNEPGIYIAGSHGIRIENEMIVQKQEANEYGQFMSFETITFAPIDIDMIDENELDEKTRQWLNTYHQEVYEKIAPFLNEEEKNWLKTYTREI